MEKDFKKTSLLLPTFVLAFSFGFSQPCGLRTPKQTDFTLVSRKCFLLLLGLVSSFSCSSQPPPRPALDAPVSLLFASASP